MSLHLLVLLWPERTTKVDVHSSVTENLTLIPGSCATAVLCILAPSGGCFIHMANGQPDRDSIGTAVTTIGAIPLTCTIAVLAYGLTTAH